MKHLTYQVVIGLEVHAQLKTEAKIFCGCSTEYTLEPNIQVCPVCAGFPGVLPVLNEKAKDYSLRTALALNCKINPSSQFARKQYFYPDLPKNYQISQYDLPMAENGFLEIEVEGNKKKIGITRVHLEEDAGKLLHYIGSQALDCSLLDLNRSGVPLLEIVSEPELSSSEEAFCYLQELKSLLKYIGVSDCNMEEGSLRCDANVSIKKKELKELGVKTELKNMNSFRAVKKALDYEVKRQTEILSEGGKIIQETRLWDEKEEVTHSMRRKEEAHDYRYFPEPDLLPVVIAEEEVEEIRRSLPESPAQMRSRFKSEYHLSDYDISVLTAEKELAEFYEEALKAYVKMGYRTLTEKIYKMIANWVMGEVKAQLNIKKLRPMESPGTPQHLSELIKLLEDNEIGIGKARTMWKKIMDTKPGEKAPLPQSMDIIKQMSDEGEIEDIIQAVLNENKDIVERFHKGEEKLFGFLVGQVMKKTKGRANPNLANKILREMLKKD